MGDNRIGIALILSASDRASAVINSMTNKAINQLKSVQKKASDLSNTSFNTGRDLAAAGLAAAVPVKKTINAFSELEDAQLSLKSTMMDAQGRVTSQFQEINNLAIQLGNELPGNTADFYNMFDVMIRNGARANDILGGTGRAAAYLAVQLKLPYESVAQFAQRLQVSTGVANNDMLAFMDTLARVKQLGPDVDEMQYAFQRSAGQLKMMKIQGLQAMQELSPAYAILIKTMGSGERVGTNFAAMLASFGDAGAMKGFNEIAKGMGLSDVKFVDKNGDFLGIDNMMKQFDKMKGLQTNQKQKLISALVGAKGGDTQIMSTLIDGGMDAYRKMQKEMKEQATLTTKVTSQLGSYKNKFDAMTGSMENTAAMLGDRVAPEFKGYFDTINSKVLPKVNAFITKHPTLVSWLFRSAIAFTALALSGAGLSFMFGGITRGIAVFTSIGGGALKFFKAMQFAIFALRYHFVTGLMPAISKAAVFMRGFGLSLLTNPLTLYVAAAIALAAIVYLVIRNWGTIKKFFIGMWNATKAAFMVGVQWVKKIIGNFTPVGLIYTHWDKITGFFSGLWNRVKGIFIGYVTWVFGLGKTFFNAGSNIVKSIWQGIKSMANKPIEAIKNIVKGIRDHLPFSPAKVGPLRDIHRIKLVETIAASIRPDSMIKAMNRTLTSFTGGLRQPSPIPIGALAGYGAGNMQVTFNITLNGGATQNDANMLTAEMKRAMDKWYNDMIRNKNRTSFAG